jgi:gliding motility-associated-like protein
MKKPLLSIILLLCFKIGAFAALTASGSFNFPLFAGYNQIAGMKNTGLNFNNYSLYTPLATALITNQPADQATCVAGNVNFSLLASDAVSYQWQVDQGSGFVNVLDNAQYSNSTSNTLTITGATIGMHNFLYKCIATGSSGTPATSKTVKLSVFNAPVSIDFQPFNRSICAGTVTTFQIGASNASSYQWQVDQQDGLGYIDVTEGSVYANVTTSTLTITAAATAGMNGYAYHCIAKGPCSGSVTSQPASLSVSIPPFISSSPSNATVCEGTATTFSVFSINASTFQWQVDDGTGAGFKDILNVGPYSGARTPGLTVNALASMNGYRYQCVAGNGCQPSPVTSGIASLTVNFQVVSLSSSNVSCNGGNNGVASVAVTGGSGSFSYDWSPGNPTGDGTSAASGLIAGTYNLLVTDTNTGCTTTKTVTITEPAALTISPAHTNVTCNGGNDGSATVTVTGGSGTYTYNWLPSGGTGATANGLVAGTYTVTIKDGTCEKTEIITITEQPALVVAASQTNVTCNGGSNGAASVTVTGGVSPYAYSWAPSGGTAASATGLSAGTYTVTITDFKGCTKTQSVTIIEPVALTATAAQTNITCNGNTDGTATVTVTGGTTPYVYTWSAGGSITNSASGLAPGPYTVNITDANGCTTSQSYTITQPGTLAASITQANVSCNMAADGSATVSATGGTAPYLYSWSLGAGNAATATGLTARTYTVTITDANQCSTVQSVTITQPPALTATTTQTNVSCSGTNNGSATVNVIGGTTPYTYNWSSGANTATASSLTAGNYSVTITDARGCTANKSVTISQPVSLSATISSQTNVSSPAGTDGSATINVSGGTAPYIYSWSPAGGSAATASGLASGTYTCSITDQNGCTTSISVNITEVPVLTAPPAVTKTYGDAPFVMTPPTSTSSGTFTYTSSDPQVASINGSTVTILKVGTTVITATQAASGKYSEASITTVYTIVPKNITVSLNATPLISKEYDGTTAATLASGNYSLNGLVGADALTISATARYNTSLAANGKTITVDNFVLAGAQKDNYSLTTVSATTTGNITKKDINLALNAAPAISKIYDGNTGATLIAANYILNTLVAGDDVTVTGTAAYDTKNAGTNKVVTVNNLVLSGAQKDNYNLITVSQTTTGSISPKPITATTAAVTKVYDGTIAASVNFNAFTAADGLVGTDDVHVSYSAASYSDKNVGTAKPINFTGLALSGVDKNNYSLNSLTINGAITARAITVTANAGSKIYGEADPILSYSVTNGAVAAGDSFSGALTRAAGESIGTYAINQGSLALSTNYVLSFTGANFSILKKDLIISADNKTRFFGSANPALTLNYSGFANGEDRTALSTAAAVSTLATITTALGDYPIVVSGAAAANYNITFRNGVLTVIPGTPTAINLAPSTLFENRPAGSAAGTLSSTSDDVNAIFSFSLVSGTGDTDNSLFSISGSQLTTTASLNYENKGNYSVRVRSTTQHGFLLEKVITISISDVNEIPTMDAIANQTFCYSNSPLVMTVTGVTAGPEGSKQTTAITASSSNNTLFSDLKVTGNQVSYQIAKGQSGSSTITLTVRDNGGTTNGGEDTYTRSFNITVKAPLQIAITSDKGTTIGKGETVHLTATGGMKYSWTSANGIIGGQQSDVLTTRPSETTTYTVRVTNSEGCDDVQTITIVATEDYQLVKGANIITPNGDGINDRLEIKNIDMYPKSELKIFDRAGRLIYSASNYKNDWDGTFQGSLLAEDSYYYIVDFGPGIGKKKGYVTIVRD